MTNAVTASADPSNKRPYQNLMADQMQTTACKPDVKCSFTGSLTGGILTLASQEPRRLYGIPQNLDDVQLLTPDLTSETFLWKEGCLSSEDPPPTHLEHPNPVPDPEDGTYPQAPRFTRSERVRSYTRGYYFVSDWSTANKNADTKRLLKTRMPPKVTPSVGLDQNLIVEPIPGMVKLRPGVPFVYHLDGDPARPMTVACLQTPESLSAYPDIADDVGELTKELLTLTFGEVQNGKVIQQPIFKFPDMKRNQRSAPAKEGSFDGSFNLAATVGQGEGQGCYMPAVQSQDHDLQKIISAVTRNLHKFYRLVVPHCVSKFEWDILEFHSIVNNVFGFGGFEPNNTGLQMNVSSGSKSLAELIGEQQGALHTDQHDHPPRYTVCTICFKLPPGT